jgi:hypothetical protein
VRRAGDVGGRYRTHRGTRNWLGGENSSTLIQVAAAFAHNNPRLFHPQTKVPFVRGVPQQVSRVALMPHSTSSESPGDTITNTPPGGPTIKDADAVLASPRRDSPSKPQLATDNQWLPPPVIAKQYGIDFPVRKRTKFSQSRFRAHWDSFTRRVGNGTAPSTSSVLDGSTAETFHRMCEPPPGQPDDEVNEVVVDRAWFGERNTPSTEIESLVPIERYCEGHTGATNTDRESLAAVEGFWAKYTLLIILRWRVWPAFLGFFRLRFIDNKSEAHYEKEAWFFRKSLALLCSLFFIGNWILALSFLRKPVVLPDKIFYYGVRRGDPT